MPGDNFIARLPRSLFDEAPFATVLIQTEYADGSCGAGTGFFFSYPKDGRHAFTIITNKHVVDGATKGRFRFHEGVIENGRLSPAGRCFDFETKFEGIWFPHPDPEIDLCAMRAGQVMAECERLGRKIYYIASSPAQAATAEVLSELRAVEDVLMIGYPNGLWDEENNLPLIRRGITAIHPAADFCGRPEGVIDIAAFPGSSGSPIMIINEGITSIPAGLVVGKRTVLLGVLFAGPVMTATGEIKRKPIPTKASSVVETEVMLHLGYYVKAREILTLCDAMLKVVPLENFD